jgi:small-conductance mechanosensitive channel
MTISELIKNGKFSDLLASPVGAVVGALVFGLIAWVIGRALRRAIRRLLAYDKRALMDRTTVEFLGQLAQIGVYLFAFISYAHLIPALSRLGTAWLAGVSVFSVIIGLAAQNTLGNLIAGISLVLYRPFKVGDRLQVAAPTGLETGDVQSVNLGYTVLKTDDNRRIVVPNSLIASQMIVSLTSGDPRVLCSVPISLHYEADLDKARSILMALAKQNPKTQSICGCPVTQVGPAGVVLTFSAWCANADDAFGLKCALLEEARKQFIQAGIVPPFPQQIVTLCQAPQAGAAPRGSAAPEAQPAREAEGIAQEAPPGPRSKARED